MSAVRIVRGTATLPPDLQEKFFRAYGREMTPEEREFFGLSARTAEGNSAEHENISQAA
jgi:CRISPR/Cas system-associated endonuclease/helicase Cas3